MSNVFTKLKFSRCKEVMSSRAAALIHLGEKEFVRGEPVIINYYEDTSVNSSINSIVAVGIKNGRGKDCYRVITLGQYEIIWGVVDLLPDISSLVHDELYLYQDVHGSWYYVSAPDGITRVIEPILPIPHMFLNVENNLIYVSDTDRQVRPIYDVYSKGEIDSILESISGGDFSSLSTLEKRLSEAYDAIQEVIQRNDELTETLEDIHDAAVVVNDFSTRVDEIERKVSSLEVNDNGTVSATFSDITLKDAPADPTPIIIDKTTIITVDNIGEAIPMEPIPIETLNNEIFI